VPGDNSYLIPEEAFQNTSDGVIIAIEVSAASKREKFPDGYNTWRKAIGIAVQAPPVEGKANKAIINLIAKSLDISQNSISIISGNASSLKRVKICGMTVKQVKDLLSG